MVPGQLGQWRHRPQSAWPPIEELADEIITGLRERGFEILPTDRAKARAW